MTRFTISAIPFKYCERFVEWLQKSNRAEIAVADVNTHVVWCVIEYGNMETGHSFIIIVNAIHFNSNVINPRIAYV